ncbi:hypothetical protein DTL42_24505 [Bremerella cremea]|uniref:Uncharacterized protein n=1 Tax=Bremerella cremea TaxID=1031537 RepID=A0A368KJ59_9BACT|nr:hypothetical protein [Bremerella cremea]RCS40539.1 hypothetical protein DTL42_24505 [Bremerella cremea]
MVHSEPNMAFGILLVAVLGMLGLAALIAMVVGLILVATKGGRILLGVGAIALLGLVVVGGGLFTILGYRTTEVIPSSVTQVAEETLDTRAMPIRQIPLDKESTSENLKQGATTPPGPKPETTELQDATEEATKTPAEPTAPGTPARTLSAAPDYPFPDMRPPHFSRPFGPYGSGFQGGYASTDPHEEIRKLRDQAMSRMQEQLYGMPAASSAEEEATEESHPSFDLVEEAYSPMESTEEAPSIIPPGRPAWVEQEPQWEDDGTYLVAVSSGPFERGMDCRKMLQNETRIALRQFAGEYLDNSRAPEMLGSRLDDLQESVVVETYHEQLNASVGPMQQWHSLLKFDIPLQQKLNELWHAQQQVSRVVYIGAGFFALLGLLSIFYIGMSLTSEGSKVSPWLVSAGTVVALGGLLVAGVIFVKAFPML